MIKRPKQVERSQKNYLSNEKYQDFAEKQFKTIYDYLDDFEYSHTTYKTEEFIVGTWVDEKPIYRKTIFIPTTLSAESTIVVQSDSDIDVIVNMKGIVVNDRNFQVTIPYAYPEQNIALYRNNGAINLYTKIQIANIYITLEYTKK